MEHGDDEWRTGTDSKSSGRLTLVVALGAVDQHPRTPRQSRGQTWPQGVTNAHVKASSHGNELEPQRSLIEERAAGRARPAVEGLDGLLDETLRVLLVFENDPLVGESLDRGSTVFDEAPRSAIVSSQFGVCTKPTLSGDEARDMGGSRATKHDADGRSRGQRANEETSALPHPCLR